MSTSERNHETSNEPSHGAAHGPPPPSEPKTPMWFTAVGALLFLTVGLAWALSPPPKETTHTPTPPAASALVEAGAPQQAQLPPGHGVAGARVAPPPGLGH